MVKQTGRPYALDFLSAAKYLDNAMAYEEKEEYMSVNECDGNVRQINF